MFVSMRMRSVFIVSASEVTPPRARLFSALRASVCLSAGAISLGFVFSCGCSFPRIADIDVRGLCARGFEGGFRSPSARYQVWAVERQGVGRRFRLGLLCAAALFALGLALNEAAGAADATRGG